MWRGVASCSMTVCTAEEALSRHCWPRGTCRTKTREKLDEIGVFTDQKNKVAMVSFALTVGRKYISVEGFEFETIPP